MNTMSSQQMMKGPGEALREARLRLGLEPDNVAQILHLSISQIAALEDNDFDRLPGATYVRGYLRSYCQLLDIDLAPVLKAFETATGDWKTTTYSNLVTDKQVTSRDSIVRIATFGIAIVIVGLTLVWWFSKGGRSTPAESVPAVSAVQPANAPDKGADLTANGAPATDGAVATAVPAGEAFARKEKSEVIAKAKPKLESTKPARESSPSAKPAAPVMAAAATTTPTPKAPAIKTAAGDLSHLVLATTAPSWVEIRDNNNNRLVYENVAAGKTVSVQGEPPFQVFVGNAAAVTLSYDGKVIDLQAHQNGPTARLTVGEADGANKAAD